MFVIFINDCNTATTLIRARLGGVGSDGGGEGGKRRAGEGGTDADGGMEKTETAGRLTGWSVIIVSENELYLSDREDNVRG